jgi:hypothetical protein
MEGVAIQAIQVGHSSPKPNPCPPGYELRGGRCVKVEERPKELFPHPKAEEEIKVYKGE